MTSQPLTPHRTLSALLHAHKGRAAVVMGGGHSLPGHVDVLRRSEPNAVYLSANEHGVLPNLSADPPEVHYIVASDDKHGRTHMPMRDFLRPFGKPIIAPRHWADYRVLRVSTTSSGTLACVAAWVMGCAPIIIAGVDMYRGPTYWHDAKAASPGKAVPSIQHRKRWELLAQGVPGAMLRAMPGALEEVFKPYSPREPTTPIETTTHMLALIGGTYVEIVRRHEWEGTTYMPGEIVELRTSEAGLFIARGVARSRRPGQDSEIIEFDEWS